MQPAILINSLLRLLRVHKVSSEYITSADIYFASRVRLVCAEVIHFLHIGKLKLCGNKWASYNLSPIFQRLVAKRASSLRLSIRLSNID